MKFDTPAGQNPIDRLTVVGQPYDRFEAKLKTTGAATYAYGYHNVAPNVALPRRHARIRAADGGSHM